MIRNSVIAGLLLMCIIFLSSCGTDTENAARDTQETSNELSISQDTLKAIIPDCNSDGKDDCTYISISFPVLNPTKTLNFQKINKLLKREAMELVSENASEDKEMNWEQIKNTFFSGYRDFRKVGGSKYPWLITLDSEVAISENRILSAFLKSYSFTGGAHGNTYTKIVNIDLKNAKLLDLKSSLKDSTAFINLAEKQFRDAEDLRPDDKLEEEGYFFENGQFSLPAEMGVKESSIILYYNTYEIKPYAEGTTVIEVPFESIDSIFML